MAYNFSWTRGGSTEGKPGYLITFDYDPDVIKELKERIPWSMREWRPDEKQWWVSEHCEKVINDLFPGFLEAVVAQKQLF